MSTTQQQLDADLQTLTTAVQAVVTAYNSLVAKLNAAGAPVDYSSEDATVQAAIASLNQLTNPPATPTPAPNPTTTPSS